jgi:hypothetical protein
MPESSRRGLSGSGHGRRDYPGSYYYDEELDDLEEWEESGGLRVIGDVPYEPDRCIRPQCPLASGPTPAR